MKIPKTKQISLKNILKESDLNYVNPNIIEENFPEQKIRGEVKIYHFNEELSSEEAVKRMSDDGYEPANLYELLDWYSKNKDNSDWIVALGSVWQGAFGARDVVCLHGGASLRHLDLVDLGDDWVVGWRFAAVRSSRKLGTLVVREAERDLDGQTIKINEVEYKLVKIK